MNNAFSETEGSVPPLPLAREGARLVRGLMLAAFVLATCLAVTLLCVLRLKLQVLAEARRSGVVALPLAGVLLMLAALTGTWLVARARVRAALADDDAWRPGAAARVPQLVIVPLLALAGGAIGWAWRPAALPVLAPADTGFALAGAAIAVSFLLLVGERMLASASMVALPEAPALRSLGFVATSVCFAAALLEIAANLGLPYTDRAGAALAFLLALVGLELSARAAGRIFLPPPAPDVARGAARSILARIVAVGASAEGGLAAPIRDHLGIDFSRSWALAYVRAAAQPMLLGFCMLAWLLSGVVLVPLDGRAVYERFGAPVAIMHPGLHMILPWPLGATRRLEFGAVHEIGLSESGESSARHVSAEDPAPVSADRLWEQPHPGEVTLIVASASAGKQSFQSVSADIRILYRVGLTDADALHAAYATVAPETLVRASAGQVISGYFAGRTLDAVLGANREAMADAMRAALQADLDASSTGMRIVAVSIEAIHPPAGAADAYHNVRAAQIAANASIAVERGAAATVEAQSRQVAFADIANAYAGATERTQAADTSLIRFQADQQAAQVGGSSFLLERYFASLTRAIGGSPKTIIDHRLNWPEAPVLDLRPFAAAAGSTGKEE